MITSLFKNCAWLQQFHIQIGLFKWYIFYKKYFENGRVSSISNSYNIRKPYPLYSNLRI